MLPIDLLKPGDADIVCKVENLKCNPRDLVPYIFEEAVSPHLAAKINNNPIELSVIKESYEKVSKNYDFMVILRSDNKKIMLKDLIKLLNLPIIIVAHAGLGTINDTVLTVEYAKSQAFSIKGIILNNYVENNIMHMDNKKIIEKLTNVPVIACVKEKSGNINIWKLSVEIMGI